MNGPGSKKGNGYPSDNPPLTVTIGSLPTFSREPAPHPPVNKTFNRRQVRDTGGWWRIVIDYGAKSAKFCLGEGERGAIPTSASRPNCECSKDLGARSARWLTVWLTV